MKTALSLACIAILGAQAINVSQPAETDDLINLKTKAALDAGLTAVLCIGETLDQREKGETDAVNKRQLHAGLEGVSKDQMGSVVIAYEPVWAIGTGKTATPEMAQDVHRHIRARLADKDASVAERVQILYGGSMKGENAAGLLSMADIDGGLIGGASLKADDFLAIAQAAAQG